MTSLHTIDLHFLQSPEVIAAFLLELPNGECAVVDCGPGSTLKQLRAALEERGAWQRLRHILLTHIHFDHAGAAGELARELGASVYVHERGAAHMQRPAKLIESATRIYGPMMEPLWGKFEPVAGEHLHVLHGGETLHLGGANIQVVYTPGHAVHHVAYLFETKDGKAACCGDVAGVRIPGATSVTAPTPPPDINLAVWRESIAALQAHNPTHLCLTHCGVYDQATQHFEALLANIATLEQESLAILRAGGGQDELLGMFTRLNQEIAAQNGSTIAQRYELATPFAMAASGLLRHWQKVRPEALL